MAVMGLRALIERILTRSAEPTEPARSVFGSEAEWELTERARADEYDLEVEKQKGRPRGF